METVDLKLKTDNFSKPLVNVQHRRLSYSRHAVDDRDLTTQQVNYKMHMNIRRMNDRKHHKRSKRSSSKVSAMGTF